jgi:hypothetical protein
LFYDSCLICDNAPEHKVFSPRNYAAQQIAYRLLSSIFRRKERKKEKETRRLNDAGKVFVIKRNKRERKKVQGQ